MTKPGREYNGWTNYATWNVPLWIDNEEPTYREKCRLIRQCDEVTAERAQQIAEMILGTTTPDLDPRGENYVDEPGWRWEDIDWDEIAGHWEDERRELVGAE